MLNQLINQGDHTPGTINYSLTFPTTPLRGPSMPLHTPCHPQQGHRLAGATSWCPPFRVVLHRNNSMREAARHVAANPEVTLKSCAVIGFPSNSNLFLFFKSLFPWCVTHRRRVSQHKSLEDPEVCPSALLSTTPYSRSEPRRRKVCPWVLKTPSCIHVAHAHCPSSASAGAHVQHRDKNGDI